MGILSLPEYVAGQGGGYSDRIDVGSGSGKPLGIEGIFEYDGFELNNRSSLDTYLVTQIDGLADPDIRDARDVNPGRHGETYFNAYYGGRTLVLTGKVRANTIFKLRDMQQALKDVFADISLERTLVIGAGSIAQAVQIDCKKSQPLVMAEIQNDFTYRRDFQLTLRASNPRFVSYVQETMSWTAAVPMSANQAVVVLTPINEGNFSAEPIIRIYGSLVAATTGGPAAILRSISSRNGVTKSKSLTLNAKPGTTLAVVSGNFLELDTARRTLTETASNGTVTNAFGQLDIASDWLELEPGVNQIELTPYAASQPQVVVLYRHTFL
jgi:hypothetical protein